MFDTVNSHIEDEKYESRSISNNKFRNECLNAAILGVNELKWTGLEYFQSQNYKTFDSGNDKQKK